MHRPKFSVHLIALAFYSLLSLALTWPLVTHLATHVPGSAVWAYDEYTFVWNMWWLKFSALNLGQWPFHTGYIFYPLGIDLVSYTLNLFNGLLGLPLQLVLPLPLASNLVILFACVMSGFGTYLLVTYLLIRTPVRPNSLRAVRLAAFIAGAAYAFTASRMIYLVLGHYNVVTAQWFPFYALFFLKTWRTPGYKNPILAGIFTTFILLAEPFFGVFWLFLTALLVVFELLDGRRRRREAPPIAPPRHEAGSRRSLILRLVVIGFTAGVLWLPVLLPMLRAYRQGGFDLAGWGQGLSLSADLAGWFTPTGLHPLFGAADWSAYLRAVVEGKTPFRDVNTVFLGYGVLALAIVGAATAWQRARAWAWGALLFGLLTLGPLLQIRGQFLFPLDNLLGEQGLSQGVTFPLPFSLLHYIPFLKANRVPNRFSVILGLSLAVLVGYGVFALLRKAGPGGRVLRGAVAVALLAVVLFDQVSVPLPLTDARVPGPYQGIAAEPGDFAVLEIPMGWRHSFGTVGAERTQLQYYQSAHGKRLLAGNTSRAPDFKFDYFTRLPFIKALIETEMYRQPDPETLAKAKSQAGDLMTLYDVRRLVIHEPTPMRYPETDTAARTAQLALSLVPVEAQPVSEADGTTVYRVVQSPVPDPLRIDFGDWTAAPYRGDGWYDDEDVFAAGANWAVQLQAQVFLPVRGAGDRTLSMQIAPFVYPGAPSQKVTFSLNDYPLDASFALNEGWQVIRVTLPEAALRQGLNRLDLHFDHATAPSAVLPGSTDGRTLAAAMDWLEVGHVPPPK